jgi:hypothetical protein
MQDRYAGDLGDFLKLGLLRWLVSPVPDAPVHRLGVVWYRVPDEYHNGDGKHVAYLDPTSAAGQDLRPLDPDLYDRLREMVEGGHRSIGSLSTSGVLPPGSISYGGTLSLSDLATADRVARITRRQRWIEDAAAAVEPCSLVFVDPDNGLRRDDHAVPSHRNKAEKHSYLSEIGRFLERGQSVVAYHHADRSEPVPDQAQARMRDINDQLGVEPLAAVRASRGTTRLFIVMPAADHRRGLEARLRALLLSDWGSELRLYRWQGSARLAG